MPTTYICRQRLEDKISAVLRPRSNEHSDEHDEKSDMKDAASSLKRCKNLPEPQIAKDRYHHNCYHDQACMPPFRYVMFVVEGRHGREHVSQ